MVKVSTKLISFLFVLANAFPRDQVPTITHSICPSDDIYNECYSLDFSGTNDDDVILLKELGPQGFATGRLQSQSDSEIVSLWNDNVGLNVTVSELIILLHRQHINIFYNFEFDQILFTLNSSVSY